MKIGKRANAKKYAGLREKQKLANEYLYGSKKYLKEGHKARANALSMKKQFYKSRGVETRGKLSFKNLSKSDLKAYENMLDSIINNTYLNPTKYQEHIKKIKENNESRILDMFSGDSTDEDAGAKGFDDFMMSDIISYLINEGINPSALMTYIQSWSTGGFSLQQFIDASKRFIEEYEAGNYSISDFFGFMDDYKADMTGV